jgi:predicted nucleic acid-binding protein
LTIVSNTSPLIALDHLGDLDLIPQVLGGGLLIPPAVAREFQGGSVRSWIEVRPLQHPLGPKILQASLGAGESEALALAMEVGADLTLLDDKAARRLALTLRLPLLGTLGLLLKAKELGLIKEIRPKLIALRTLPFHIAPKLYAAVLKDARESRP